MTITLTKRVDMGTLGPAIRAVDPAISMVYITTEDGLLHVQDIDGTYIETPEVLAVVDAHVAPLRAVEYAGTTSFDAVVRTTDATPVEIVRIPTLPQHVYRATVRVTGIDAGTGTTRDTEARMVFKRLAASLAQVGTTAILANFADTAAASWAVLPSVDRGDLVLSVRGAAERTIDWLTVGEVGAYAPGGLPAAPPQPPVLPPSEPALMLAFGPFLPAEVPPLPPPTLPESVPPPAPLPPPEPSAQDEALDLLTLARQLAHEHGVSDASLVTALVNMAIYEHEAEIKNPTS
jgi:hypothetical protein